MLIAFEGIDGAGKSTQARLLYEYLKENGYKVSLYREPGATDLAEKIRDILLNYSMDPITELLLFESARSSLMWEKILPDLNEGKIVIVDRFIYSTLAYQGYGRGLDLKVVNTLNHIATRGRNPDIVFLLNIPVEIALQRLKDKKTRFEEEAYLRKVRDAFILIAEQEKDKIVVLDGTKSKEQILQDILNVLYNI